MKHLVGDIPYHVPIRKENRWEPIQHYAITPNIGVATIPMRRSAVPELHMPTRQDSFSSYISRYSTQNRDHLSNKSVASMSREGGNDDHHQYRNTVTGTLSPRPRSSKSLFSNSLLDNDFKTNEKIISKAQDWFQHSDDSSASLGESEITKPLSGSSLMTSVNDSTSTTESKCTTSDNYTASEISDFSELSWPSAPAQNRVVITEESVKRVVRESALHSCNMSSPQTMTSETTTSTKLERLRERMKRLREKNQEHILQSRLQLQKTQSPSRNTIESSSQSTSSSLMSDASSINSDPSCERPETIRQPSKAYLHSMNESQSISDESSVQTNSFARVPFYSIAKHSKCTAIAEEEVEVAEAENDYDPAFDQDIDISTSFDSSKQDSIGQQTDESNLDEDLYINSSFDSSKCSTIAEEVVQSLRAERKSMNSVAEEAVESLRAEVRANRQYHPGIHITRHYSMGTSTKKTVESPRPPNSPSSSARSQLQQKLERRGRRPRSKMSSPMTPKVQVKESRDHEMTPEAKNLAKELHEALTARGPPMESEDSFQFDGILPLASEDSLSSPVKDPQLEFTPKSFRERRDAYLKRIGYSKDQKRKSPFTTANLVLGKLPEKLPDLPSPSPFSKTKEVKNEPIARSFRRRSRKMKARKNALQYSNQDVADKSFVSPKEPNEDGESKNHERHLRSRRTKKPMRETGKSQTTPQNWAQNSFLHHQTRDRSESGIDLSTKQTRRVSKEKKKCVSVKNNSKSSSTDKKEKPIRKQSKKKAEVDTSGESPIQEKATVKDIRRPSSTSRPAKRNSKQSALDHAGERNSSKLSQRLLGISSKSLLEIEGELSDKSPSSKSLTSKSSSERKKERRSKRVSGNSTKSSGSRGRDTFVNNSSRKPLRSPSMTPTKMSQVPKDNGVGHHDMMDSTHHVSNTSSGQNSSSWSVEKADTNEINEKIKASAPSSERLGLVKKSSLGRFGMSSSKEGKPSRKRLSKKIAAIVSKFSSDKGEEKMSKAKRVSYQNLEGHSFEDDDFEDITNLIPRKANVERRDDSNRSLSNTIKPKRPSSLREGAARSVSRNNSYTSNTVTTAVSDPSSSDSSSDHNSSSSESSHSTDGKKLKMRNHGRRTRPRENISNRSTIQRFRRYKDYRKNGVLVDEHKRFHIDMTGGIR